MDERMRELVRENLALTDALYNNRLYLTAALEDLKNGRECDACGHAKRAVTEEPCCECINACKGSEFFWRGFQKFSGMPGYVPVTADQQRLCHADQDAHQPAAADVLAPA